MQGDIIDAILKYRPGPCRVLDPFVGSGTVMTEALVRDLDFTGVDINPLAALVCEAKAAIDAGADVEGAAQTVLTALRIDLGGHRRGVPGTYEVVRRCERREVLHAASRDPASGPYWCTAGLVDCLR